MSTEALFQRFVEQTPVTVMVRATLENVFSAGAVDEIFAASAQRQRPSELLFSSVVDLLSLVVFRERRSINEAYLRAQDQFAVSINAVYDKLNGVETTVCRELVRRTGGQLVTVVGSWKVPRRPLLRGYRTRILDGNHLAATEHRLEVLRHTRSGPLPGQARVVLDPDRMLITDLFPWEDGHSQERRILPQLIPTAQEWDLWIADRNFCTTDFLFGLVERKACFVIRQHASTLSWEQESKPKKIGRCPTGVIYEQTLQLTRGEETLAVRRITIRLDEPNRAGETEIHLLTNLPRRAANAYKVAELYLERWTIESAFQELEQALRSEIDTLGYPGAALLGFSIAALTYNVLSIAKWAIELEHGAEGARDGLSGYYLAAAVAEDYSGMMIAIPEKEWTKRFAELTPRELGVKLREYARSVRPQHFRKNKRGPKLPRPPRTSGTINHHVSTARLIATRK
jgi:Transposase DDE domain